MNGSPLLTLSRTVEVNMYAVWCIMLYLAAWLLGEHILGPVIVALMFSN